jgi:hypothetical protein
MSYPPCPGKKGFRYATWARGSPGHSAPWRWLVFFLVETIGWQGWLALPPLVWLHWRRHPDPRDFGPRVTGAPGVPETYWLEDAYASRQRGTGISTLAVRYDVDPDWLESELSRFAPTPRV